MPRHHQSAAILCPYWVMTSGAKYSGVPTIDWVTYPFDKNLANP